MSVILIFRGKTHKENENISDCQDYYQTSIKDNCFAIADGASQSFYPSIWAELLVNHFCKNPDIFCKNPDINGIYDLYFLAIIKLLNDQNYQYLRVFNYYFHTLIYQRQINQKNWKDWLQPIQEKWLVEVKQRVIKAKSENSPVWVTNQNRFNSRESATSTFIGLQFIGDKVKFSIVGDSCLFMVEGDQSSQKYKLIKTFLLEKSKDFNDFPGYFASYEKDNNFTPCDFKIPLKRWKKPRGEKSQKNLFFILATDALSEYIFKCTENKNDIFKTLLNISSQETFEDFVASARNSDNMKMKNDDVTLLILFIPDRGIDQSSLQLRDEIEETPKVSPDSSNEEYGKGNNSSSQSTDEVERKTNLLPSSTHKQSGKETKNSLNVIFHKFRQLISALKFPNLTQENIPKVQISYSRDDLVSMNENLQKENTKLKHQLFGLRLGLGICLFGILLLFNI